MTVRIGCAIVMLLVACGCEPEAGSAPVWRVERDNRESFLLGTLHDGVEYRDLPSAVTDALDRARVVITEADVRGVDEAAFREAIALPVGVSLRDYLDEPAWIAVANAFAGIFPPAELERTQPWFLQGLLVSSWNSTDEPIDTTLVRHALEADKPLGFLETWEEQTEALNGLGVEDGLAGLMPAIWAPDQARAVLEAWIAAYQAGDTEQLTELAFSAEDMALRPRFFAEIVFGRTLSWLAPLEAELTAGDALIAVGFMHLLTDAGLVCLLEQRGYAVVKLGSPARRSCRW